MSKRILLLTLTALTLSLTACQESNGETPGAVQPTEEESPQEETDKTDGSLNVDLEETDEVPKLEEVKEDETDYRKQFDHAKEQFDAKQWDAAAGTLSTLLEKDLNAYPILQAQAQDLKEELDKQLAEIAREVAGASTEVSEYAEERQSSLIAEQYLEATGKEMTEATDEELGTWLAAREEEKEEKAGELTKEEAEDRAFEILLAHQESEATNYFYFVNQEDTDWVKIEVRESVEQDGVEWSNLIGMYRMNSETEEIQKLDSVSGIYETLE